MFNLVSKLKLSKIVNSGLGIWYNVIFLNVTLFVILLYCQSRPKELLHKNILRVAFVATLHCFPWEECPCFWKWKWRGNVTSMNLKNGLRQTHCSYQAPPDVRKSYVSLLVCCICSSIQALSEVGNTSGWNILLPQFLEKLIVPVKHTCLFKAWDLVVHCFGIKASRKWRHPHVRL